MSFAFNIIRAADLQAVPWKNGGGATREIAVSPKGAAFDAFDWRVSVADVSEAGAFSVFEGIDRVLALIEGEQMVLIDSTGPEYVLSRWDCVAFAGEASISAELPHGPTRDFNLMLRRDRVAGHVTVRRAAEELHVLQVQKGSIVLVCALGEFAIDNERLFQGDALVFDASENGALSIEPLSPEAVLIDARIVSKDHGNGL